MIPFQRDFFDDESKMDDFVKNCDVIVHLAGLNRSNDEEVIFNINVSLTKTLISSLNRTKSKPHIIFASSSQEYMNNVYGKSKKIARLNLKNWSLSNNSISCRLYHLSELGVLTCPREFNYHHLPPWHSHRSTLSRLQYQYIRSNHSVQFPSFLVTPWLASPSHSTLNQT